MKVYEFEILGTSASSDAVIGLLSAPRSGKPARAVLLLPPADLTEHKARERIQQARDEVIHGELLYFPGSDTMALSGVFTSATQNDIKASLSYSETVKKIVDVMFEESRTPLVILDAKNPECFWTALRTMGADHHDLLAVAELSALKPGAQTRRVSKPIGEAHLLCRDILDQRQGLDSFSDYKSRDLINMVRRSIKVKLPAIDLDDQALGSHYLRELVRNTGRVAHDVRMGRAIRSLRARLPFSRVAPEEVVTYRHNDSALRNISETRRLMQNKSEDSPYAARYTNLPHFNVLRGDPQEVLTRLYRENYGFDADVFDFDRLIQKVDNYGQDTLQFRQGIHVSPFDAALFETDLTKGEQGRVMTFATLVLKDAEGLTAYNFYKPSGEQSVYILSHKKMHVALSGFSADSISIFDMQESKVLTQGKGLEFDNIGDMAFMHVLSAIARMNDPDFAPVTYESKSRGLVDISKGKFPYFDYIGIESFGPAASHLQIGHDGKTSEAMRFHLVRGHPRRLRDNEGNIREIIMIPQHSRGSESKGVLAKGYTLDK